MIMKNQPRVGLVCVGDNALELSSAVCCAAKLIKMLKKSGYTACGCYSAIEPAKNPHAMREKLRHLCSCSELVATIGCDGFRKCDVIPDITSTLGERDAAFFAYWLSAGDTAAGDGSAHDSDFTYPSRATAAFCNGALLINLPCDPDMAKRRLYALLPSIGFAVTSSGKCSVADNGIENLILNYYSEKSI